MVILNRIFKLKVPVFILESELVHNKSILLSILGSGYSKMAIAGGVNLNLSPTPYVGLSRISALSSTGTCYPFDSRANGMVLSEGSSAVLLKPLEDAIRDKDNIMAVIKGSAINNDGHSQGITAPRPQGQAEAIRKAYLEANVNPETVSYVETQLTVREHL